MALGLGFLTKQLLADQALNLVTGRKNKEKQPPTKETWKNYMGEKGEKPASKAIIDVEVLGKETVGANANDLGTFTKAPKDPKPESTGNEDSIVAQINQINANIASISNAMQSSADIEEEYRKNLKEDLEQDIADRDKLQAKERAKNRRDSFRKNLLSGPKKVAGVAGNTAAKGFGLEFLAQLLNDEGTTETDQNVDKSVDQVGKNETINLLQEEQEDKNKKGNWFTNFFRGTVMGENAERKRQIQRVETGETPRYGFFGPINKTTNNNETNNEIIDEINNNTTNKNSTNNVTKVNDKTTNLTTNIQEGGIKEGDTNIEGNPAGTSNQSNFIDGIEDKQVKSNTKKSTESLIAGITDASAKMAPVEDQKGSIRVFDHTSKRSGKGDGGTTIGKGVSDEVPSLSPERRVSPNEIFQRSSVA